MAKQPDTKPDTKAKQPSTELAALSAPEYDADALAALDDAGVAADDSDGMAEFRPSDFRTPVKLFNVERPAKDGKPAVGKDQWFDSLTETTTNELNLALLEVHRTNLYEVYDAKDNRNKAVCASFDRVQGTMHETGMVRPCKGCPDAQWKVQADGRRRPLCSEVWNAAALDLDSQQVTLIRFKRTSLDPLRNYMQAHHLGRRPLGNGKRGNIPLFAYRVRARLEMAPTGKYALPVLERGALFRSVDLRTLAETAEGVRQTLRERLADADEHGTGDAVDTSFDTEQMDAMDAAAAGGERGGKAFVA